MIKLSVTYGGSVVSGGIKEIHHVGRDISDLNNIIVILFSLRRSTGYFAVFRHVIF